MARIVACGGCWIVWLAAFVATVVAAQDPYSRDLLELSTATVVAVLGLALLSGVAALLIKLTIAETHGNRIVGIGLFAAANISASLTSGIVGMAIARWNAWGFYQCLLIVMIFSFGGATIMQALVDKVIRKLKSDIES